MVGPLSTEEIEDVVSSVRRLVSNEQNPRVRSRDLSSERLLLTPSLRVVSEVSPLAPLVLDALVAEARSDDPAPADEGLVADAADDTAVDLVEADWEDELWASGEHVSLGEAALEAEEAEVLMPPAEALASDAGDDAADGQEPWVQPGPEWTEDEPIPFIPLRRRAEHLAARLAAGAVNDPDDDVDDGDADVEQSSTLSVTEGAPDVAPELLEDELALDAESDDPLTSPYDGDAAGDASDDTDMQRMPTEFLDADGMPLAVLDEAALQEIVRQMIREELQGSLGERITRNVRKLVRAEINRALIARDLD